MNSEYYSDIPPSMLKNKRILEVGSGYGKNQLLSRHRDIFLHADYIGYDLFLQQKPLLNIVASDIRNVEFEKESFDVILIMHCIEHIPIEDWAKLLDKLVCALRVGGWFVIAAPYNESEKRPYDSRHIVFDINENMLAAYFPRIRLYRSSIYYPRYTGVRKLIWWSRRFFRGDRVVPLGILRMSFIGFWKKEIEE